MTDPISDMLTRIRNALMVKSEKVKVPNSRIKVDLSKVLKDEGYIKDFSIHNDKKNDKKKDIDIKLVYDKNGESVIQEIKRVSKPSRRIYVDKHQIPRINGGLGICILTTSKGIMTGTTARRLGIGGEIICTVL